MNEEQELIDQKFGQIVNKPVTKVKQAPAKFPELKYLWGITLLGSFILVVITTLITSIIESL
jgi:hypothetical protein